LTLNKYMAMGPSGVRCQEWPCWLVAGSKLLLCSAAGSNTSTVTLRVVGGDEKGSLESETVKYSLEFQGTQTGERLHWQEPAAHTKDRPVLSSERASHGIKNVTVKRIPYSERKKNLIVSPAWVLYTKRDWPTDRRS
jgi:hypothetical protein